MYSLVDQAVVSGGNFLTTLILARALAPSDFGTFSLLFLSLFALNTCHSSLIIYPLTLRGATASSDTLSRLTGSALIHTIFLAIPLSAVLAATAFSMHRLYLFPYLFAAMVLWQLQETVRRALLCSMRISSAILPDCVCYVGQAVTLFCFHPRQLSIIFVVVAVTSLIAAMWQATLVRVTGLTTLSVEHGRWSWATGKFILAGNALNMIGLQWPSWMLLASSGAVMVAQYQSLLSLAGVANPVIFSINSLLIPIIAREDGKSTVHVRMTALRYGAKFGVILIPMFLFLSAFPLRAMRLVYGQWSPYLSFAPLLRVMIFAFCLQYLATVVGAYEGGRGRPRSYMWSQLVSIGALVTLGTLLIREFGVMGATAAMVMVGTLKVLSFLYVSWSADHTSATSELLSLDHRL